MREPIPAAERLIFALDVPGPAAARKMVEELGDAVRFYKLGLELFTAGDYFGLVTDLVSMGKKVFADLKLFDVPETVAAATRQVARSGASFLSVHGNDAILRAACRDRGPLKILAVTVLTSLDRADIEDLGFKCSVEDLVASRARRAIEIGCDGVISSGLEVGTLRADLGEGFMIVAPGIRPVDNRPEDDQKRIVSPEEALRSGADYIVVGRPIRDAPDPRQAAEAIQQTIAGVYSDRAGHSG